VGRTLADQRLDELDVAVVSVRRHAGASLPPAPTLALQPGDTLVLSGRPEPLALAESRLLGER
jgi:CPA2 family monovalent cation:H+ antiporter-2